MNVVWTPSRFGYYESVVPDGWDGPIHKEIGHAMCARYRDAYDASVVSISYLRRQTPREDLDTLDEAVFPKWAFERERRQWMGEEDVLPQFPRGTATAGGIYIFEGWPTGRRPPMAKAIEKVRFGDDVGILVTSEVEALALAQLEFRDWFRDLTSPKIHILLAITGPNSPKEVAAWKPLFLDRVVRNTRFV